MPGEGKAQQPKALQIRILGEKTGERRQLAWVTYRYGQMELQIGPGRSPHHVSHHPSGEVHFTKAGSQDVPLDLPIAMATKSWKSVDLRCLAVDPKKVVGKQHVWAVAYSVGEEAWQDYPMPRTKKDRETLSIQLDGVSALGLAFWVADSRNAQFFDKPCNPVRTNHWMLETDLLLILRAELEPEGSAHAV